ncbi:hypothetical protein BDW59DRAFT_163275 [Aspergillus cavernicola]|uniref:Uncharacterized protein n=1 Tax=Aspergillus cavernicola TaxID=176166 RepID=A0ABR4I6W9_9EURO
MPLPHLKPSFLPLLSILLTLPHQTTAQSLPSSIIGCNSLSCPLDNTYKCHLEDTTYTNVGLARIPSPPSSLDGLSLLKAVHVADAQALNITLPEGEDDVPYRSAFYLGIPEENDVGDISGCAVFFNEFPGMFEGGGEGGGEKEAVGTCPDVIEQECIDALTQLAKDVVDGENGSGDICGTLRTELREISRGNNSNSTGSVSLGACRNSFSGQGNILGNFTVSSLADLMPIAGSQNASSDCWPASPKTDGLAYLGEVIMISGFTDAESISELFQITPILTVFPAGSGSEDQDTSAQLTCLKAVEVIDSSEDGQDGEDGGDEDGNGDAGALFSANMPGVGAAVVAASDDFLNLFWELFGYIQDEDELRIRNIERHGS